jgi:hypothetical protein
VNARREAVFGDETVAVHSVSIPEASNQGVLTGVTLAGYCEVEMPTFDAKKHWYPIDDLLGANGEKIVEEEIPIDVEEEDELEDE